MALQPINGYGYVHGSSTAGILYHVEGNPHFQEFVEPAGDPFRVPEHLDIIGSTHLIACSSSRGLVVLLHFATNLYFIGNPFLHPQPANAYVLLPPPPRFHNVDNTHVVLANCFISPELNPHPVFHLICAVCLAPGNYVFDIYSSINGFWTSTVVVDFGDRDIMLNTGVSCDHFAYWLTQSPNISVLRFDVWASYQQLEMEYVTFWPLAQQTYPFLDHPMTRLQLGRVLEVELGLVAVIGASDVPGPRVELFIVRQDDGVLNRYAVLNLTIRDDVNWNNVVSREFPNALECRDLPRPIRSESFKMEVLLWVDERVVLWENNTVQPEMSRASLLPHNADAHIVSGIAHIWSTTQPGIFKRFVDEDDDEEDNDDQDSDHAEEDNDDQDSDHAEEDNDDQDSDHAEEDNDVQDADEDGGEESDVDDNNNNDNVVVHNVVHDRSTDEEEYETGSSVGSSCITFQDPDEDRVPIGLFQGPFPI